MNNVCSLSPFSIRRIARAKNKKLVFADQSYCQDLFFASREIMPAEFTCGHITPLQFVYKLN